MNRRITRKTLTAVGTVRVKLLRLGAVFLRKANCIRFELDSSCPCRTLSPSGVNLPPLLYSPLFASDLPWH